MTALHTADTARWRNFDVVSYATDPNQMLPAQLREWAVLDPHRPFLIEATGRTADFGETWMRVRRWVSWLRAEGIEPGDHVATVLPPSIDAVTVWIALGCVGAVEVPVNPELTVTIQGVVGIQAPVVKSSLSTSSVFLWCLTAVAR